jgi:NAD(P)-dependent dehydrogenase (short-subunit alcohol dehydrogenase family)
VVYSASKARGAGAHAAVAADESPYGVRVNCVSPSTVEGPWLQRLSTSQTIPLLSRAVLEAHQPMRQFARGFRSDELIARRLVPVDAPIPT